MKYFWGISVLFLWKISFAADYSVYIIEGLSNFETYNPLYKVNNFEADANQFQLKNNSKIQPFSDISFQQSNSIKYQLKLASSFQMKRINGALKETIEFSNLRFRFSGKQEPDAMDVREFGSHAYTQIYMDIKISSAAKIESIQNRLFHISIHHHQSDQSANLPNLMISTFSSEDNQPLYQRYMYPELALCYDQRAGFTFSAAKQSAAVRVVREFQNLFANVGINIKISMTNVLEECHVILSNIGTATLGAKQEENRGNTLKLVDQSKYFSIFVPYRVEIATIEPGSLLPTPDREVMITLRHELMHVFGFEHIDSRPSILQSQNNMSSDPSQLLSADIELLQKLFFNY